MHFTLVQIVPLILQYKYLILFPLLVVEGPLVTIVAAFLASPAHREINLYLLFFEVVAADLFGDVFYYCLGRFGGTRIVSKWGGKFGLTKERFEKIEKHFKYHGGKTIAAAKIGHGFGWPAMIAAGATCMNFLKFFSINSCVSLIKSAVLIFLGYYYGKSSELLGHYIHYGGFILSAVLIGAIIIYFAWKRK